MQIDPEHIKNLEEESQSGKGFTPNPKGKSKQHSNDRPEQPSSSGDAALVLMSQALGESTLNTSAVAGQIARQFEEANYKIGQQLGSAIARADAALIQGFMEAIGQLQINSQERLAVADIPAPTVDVGVRQLGPVQRGEEERALSMALYGKPEVLTQKRLSAAK